MHAPRRPSISSLPSSGFAAMIAANIVLAFGPWLVRLTDVGPVAAGFWRLTLATPVLAVLLWALPKRREAARVPMAMWVVLAVGGLFFAADLATWHVGIHLTRLANSTLFGNITSFVFPIYGYVVARSWPGRWQAAALVLAGLGTARLLGRSFELSRAHLVGDLLCIVAGVFYTVYLIAIDRTRSAVTPLPALAMATAAGTLPLLLAALAMGEQVWPGAWTPLVLLALGSQLIGQGLMVYAVGQLRPVVIGLGFLLQPVIAATIGRAVYGEALELPDLVGAAAIAVALVLVRRPEQAGGGRGPERDLRIRPRA